MPARDQLLTMYDLREVPQRSARTPIVARSGVRGVAVPGLLLGTQPTGHAVPLTITCGLRDATYETVLSHFTGSTCGRGAAPRPDTARRLGRGVAENVRLLEDLGWTETIDLRSQWPVRSTS